MLDKKLLDILVCPQCRGGLTTSDAMQSLVCNACQLKFPVRDDIPIMLLDEASDLRSGAAVQGRTLDVSTAATFKIISGPNKGLSFHLDRFTCKAIGRSISDPNKTTMFNVEVGLALDEGTKGLIQHYIAKQFKPAKRPAGAADSSTGVFKRTSDIVLDDASISRLHAMIFYGESGVGILDLVSKNGTFVGGEEIESRLLRKGDTIEFGETKILYEG